MNYLKAVLSVVLLVSSSVTAKTLNISVADANGDQLKDAVVYIESSAKSTSTVSADVAIMDQVNRQFSPHILPIQQGQQVRFPNSDSIKHHVYSFSPANVFELQLYQSNNTQMMRFANAGVVELGCNIHDWMLGYIFVSPSPWFAQTNQKGDAAITVSDADFKAMFAEPSTTLRVWHPALQTDDADTRYPLSGNDFSSEGQALKIALKHPVSPQYHSSDDLDDEFAEYE